MYVIQAGRMFTQKLKEKTVAVNVVVSSSLAAAAFHVDSRSKVKAFDLRFH